MLTLPIKRKWLDMIIAGVKLEEYRDYTPYYISRIGHLPKNKEIMLRNGYTLDSPSCIIITDIYLGFGLQEWGVNPDILCFVIKINNVKQIYLP